MNLHGVVTPAISAVNPPSYVTIEKSIGYTTDVDGTQIPQYCIYKGNVNVQALAAHELAHLNSLNIQSVTHKLYAFGNLNSVVRDAAEGGDLLNINGDLWKVVHVFEAWADWCAVGIKRQVS